MAWAQLPTRWLLEPPRQGEPSPLAELHWRDHRAGGIAALLVLITLATRLNELNRALSYEDGANRTNKVQVTWDDLQQTTGFARATIGKAIMLLEAWGAICVEKVGRASRYELLGVEADGGWCKLPQSFLEENGDPISRFRNLPASLIGLNALKLYVALLALRSKEYQTTSISFNGITRWTGIRREDIRKAWAYLDGQQLAAISYSRDARHNKLAGDDQSQRYAIYGLTPGFTKRDLAASSDEPSASSIRPSTTGGIPFEDHL